MRQHEFTDDIGSNFGMTSLVIGLIALALFFIPVLAIPLSLCGLVLGMIGVLMAFIWKSPALRPSLSGLAVSSIALGAVLAIIWEGFGNYP